MNETELVRRFLDGDREAFEEIINLYQAQALRSAYLISGNYADSEDIVQETFVACFLNRTQIRDPEAFRSWFYRTLSRNAWRICKKKRREQPAEELYPEDEPRTEGLLDQVVLREEERTLLEAVGRLPVKQRTVTVLYYYNDMPVKEIAKTLGCLEGTVKSRLYAARAELRKAMAEYERKGEHAWTILS